MSTGLSLVTERSSEDFGQPILNVDEELMRVQTRVSIVLDNYPPESPGTLFITNKRVIWLSDSDRSKGYCVDFLSISLHAVSTDPQSYPSPCIYAQIDTGADGEESEESDSESNEIDRLSQVTEMRLVPSDPSQLDAMFQIFCECAELNPGPVDDNVDDEGEHNWVFSADQIEIENGAVDEFDGIPQNPVNAIGSNGNRDLAQRVLQDSFIYALPELQINDQRFEDAEEELENGDAVNRD